MNIYDQLQAVEDRYEELGELLSDPDVVSDTKRFMELSKEEASTRDTVTAYREYKQVLQNIVDAEEMIKESGGDADLEEMAKLNLDGYFVKNLLIILTLVGWLLVIVTMMTM